MKLTQSVAFIFSLLGCLQLVLSTYPQELITHAGLNQFKCYNSNSCAHDEKCERVCFWEQFTEAFQGCKVMCVKRHPEVPRKGYDELLPLPVLPPQMGHTTRGYGHHRPATTTRPRYGHHTQTTTAHPRYPPSAHHTTRPTYPPPHTAHYTPAHQQRYPQGCRSGTDCGANQMCNYSTKQCQCFPGFARDPMRPNRCVSLQPVHGQPMSPGYPTTHYTVTPSARQCYTQRDCRYGMQCCRRTDCNAFAQCKTVQECKQIC